MPHIYYTRGIQKVLRQILKKNSEYGNQIESCKYSHLIWLPYSEVFFLEFVLELFECPSYMYKCHVYLFFLKWQ